MYLLLPFVYMFYVIEMFDDLREAGCWKGWWGSGAGGGCPSLGTVPQEIVFWFLLLFILRKDFIVIFNIRPGSAICGTHGCTPTGGDHNAKSDAANERQATPSLTWHN